MAIEVKSGRGGEELRGLQAFRETSKPHRGLFVGAEGIPLEKFLTTPVRHWFEC